MFVFLFTDIEGSTRLWEEHTGEMGQVIARHDVILREQIEGSGGRITKHTGDGVTAAFEQGEPVACALETQKHFASEAWGAIGELRIRIGLHAGEAELHGEDYFGPAVNCTARVMSAGWGGQILLTPEVTRVSPLPDEATLRDLGQHLLKDVSAAQQIYQLQHPDLSRLDFPPLRTLSGNAIHRTVDQEGQRLVALPPPAIAIGLVSATLLPTMLGDVSPPSPALAGNLGVLGDIGAGALRDWMAGFVERLQGKLLAGEAVTELAIREQLEMELLQRWQAGGEASAALRADASRLLEAVHGVEAAMQAAGAEWKDALAQGLADLGASFVEFRWMLSGLQEALTKVQARQSMQIAMQKEQLDLQRQQLVKTNLILRRQQAMPALAPLAAPAEEEELAPADVQCPYKGLAAFEAEDAEYFCGREKLVAELTVRLAGTPFLAVVGPSGSGKSSLVRAGLLPAIWQDALPGSNHWLTLVLTPGHHPLSELAARLSLLNGLTPGDLLRDLEADHRGLDLAIRRLLADQPQNVHLLLIVDQFEEIFALCRDEEERRRFINALVYAVEAEDSRVIVLPTIRADFFGRCAGYPELASRLRDSVLVGPLSEEELRQVIERPAELVGLRLEPGLVDTVVGDIADEPGALPLLSHALLETWERRRGRTLTLAGYAQSGGVAGAIAQTADTVYGQLQPQQQATARGIFLRLTELGQEGAQDTRRRVAPVELIPRPEDASTVEAVLKTLADARLITTGAGPVLSGAEGTVEVAHEALIREWPALRGWLDEDREGLRVHRHLTDAAQEWERLDRDPGEMYRGARLATASEWAEQHAGLLNPLEREFLAASQGLAWSQERERQRRRQRTMVGLATALAITLFLALLAVGQWQRAQRGEHKALLQASAGLATRAVAELESAHPERGVLLALEALQRYPYTAEAQRALAQAVRASVPFRVLPSPGRDVVNALWSPVGQRVAAAAPGESLVVWDADTGDEVWRTVLAAAFVSGASWGLAWAPSGAEIAACGENRIVIFDAATGALLRRIEHYPINIVSLAWAPHGDWILGSNPIGDARVWDTTPEAGKTVWERRRDWELVLSGHGDAVMDSTWSPAGKRICTASADGTARVWDAETGIKLLTLSGHDGALLGAAWSPDGEKIATASVDGTARVWSAANGELILSLVGHSDEVRDVAWSPDGNWIATTSPDGTTRVWSARTGQELFAFPGPMGDLQTVSWSPQSDQLVTGGGPLVTLWQLPRDELELVGHTGDVLDARWSPDGARIVTAGDDGTARIWDATTGEPLLEFSKHDGAVHSASWSGSGKRMVTTGADGTARVWHADSGEELFVFSEHDSDVWHADWSPDGEYLVTTGGDVDASQGGASALVWDATTGETLRTLYPGLDRGRSLWSPDGQRIVTAAGLGGSYKPVWVWDAATTGRRLVGFENHEDWATSADWSPDGGRVVSAGYDATARVWDAVTGDQLVVLMGHSGVVHDADWSPDGMRIASGEDAGEVKIWDAATGKEIDSFAAEGAVWNVEWSPDGRYVMASGHFNPPLVRRTWQSTEELIAYARQCCASRELTPEERELFGLAPE
jgi:WD40 repeat protein/class 3 adenylate cyclase